MKMSSIFTQRHYKLIGEVLRECYLKGIIDYTQRDMISRKFANLFEKDNELFSDIRFIEFVATGLDRRVKKKKYINTISE